jgi:pimeloyl-ACP methyl ester carboxylesterase
MQLLSRVAPEGAAAIAERLFLTPHRHPRPEAELELLATAHPIPFATRYGELAAWEWGSEGPSVLLVHGWEGRGAQLGALVAPLVAVGFRVVTFDAPGHGDSPGERSSFFHFAEAVERAAKTLGPFHAVVAHSMGGATTLWASRLGPLAARLVLIAPPLDLRDFTRTLSSALGLPEGVRKRVHRRLGARFGVPIETVRAEGLAATMRGALLVVHDENDREVPIACGEAIARAWPGAELVRTRGLGHQRILRDAATLKRVVRFVAQNPRGGLESD